ncbi:MAG: TraB family protein [Gammaproteobacteria bacterium]|nr:TraB family protein [Gammaproteobacteria bacterium]
MSEPQLAESLPAENEPLVTLKAGERQVTILGTAHISKASADKVDALIGSGRYDAVAIELCPSRHHAMIEPDSLANMDLVQVVREGKASMIAAHLALGAYQQRMAEQLGVMPGAEMRKAIECAQKHNLPVLLIDRDVATTLKRIYRNVSWWRRFELITTLVMSVMSRQKVSAEEIERLKEGDMLETAFTQFAEQAEQLYVPLIEERDRYMSARIVDEIDRSEARHILAVVGAGHLKGMQSHLGEDIAVHDADAARRLIADLETVPPPSRWPKLIPWAIVAVILFGFVLGFKRSPDMGWQMVWDWVVVNGGLAAIGALLARGHPITIVTAFLAAPLTSLNPAIGAGMVTGAMEAWLRRPNVGDFSRLRTDTSTIAGWWRNRVSRVLLVFLFSTIGSAIGTYVAGAMIFNRLTGAG